MATPKRPAGTYPKQKVPGPEGFSSLPDKEKPSAAAEWVQNTSSGNQADDSAYYDVLMRQSGLSPKGNPFRKKR